MCDPILVTIENAIHYSQSSRENVTQSSGTSSLASEKEVYPPAPDPLRDSCWHNYLFYV